MGGRGGGQYIVPLVVGGRGGEEGSTLYHWLWVGGEEGSTLYHWLWVGGGGQYIVSYGSQGEEDGGVQWRVTFLKYTQSLVSCRCVQGLLFSPDMFEERALLLSKTGHHEVALAIYVHVLNDQTMAEE